jgi:peptidyl-prolyl cis-trans isomerase SurA
MIKMIKPKNDSIRYLVITFASFFCTPTMVFADTVAIDRVIAVANDGVIFSSQLEERMNIVKHQAKSSKDMPPDDVLRQQVIERLISESLQLQLAERAGITVSNEDLQSALQNIAHQNDTDIAGLQKKIEAEGITFKNFTKNIEQEIIMQRVQQVAISKRVVISDQDVINFLNSEEGKQRSAATYHLAHILVPVSDDASDGEKSKAQALANQIVSQARGTSATADFSALARKFSKAQDASTGGDLGWRKKIDMPSLYAEKVDLLDAGMISEPFFAGGGFHILKMLEKRGTGAQWVKQTRVRHILVKPSIIRTEEETVQLLEGLRQKIASGTDFAEIAKKYSEDYVTALKGGDLNWIIPGQLTPPFQTVMDETAVNDISHPFKTQYGWHILQVQERRDQDMGEDLLKQSAKNFLTQRRFEEELPIWLKEIRDEAYVDIKTRDDEQAISSPVAPVVNSASDAVVTAPPAP